MIGQIRAGIADGTRTMNAAAIDHRAAQIAAAVASANSTGTAVAVALSDAADSAAAVVGSWRAEATPAPVSDRAPRSGSAEEARLTACLENLGSGLVVADEAHCAVLRQQGLDLVDAVAGTDLAVLSRSTNRQPAHLPPGSLIIHTSGSTGVPKAAIISNAALSAIDRTNAWLYRWRADDVFLTALPPTHLAGLTNVLSALAAGVPVHVAPPFLFADRVAEVMESAHVTVAGLVPQQLHRLFLAADPGGLASLRLAVSSAAPLTSSVIEQVRRVRPELDLRNAYGLTEAFRSLVGSVDDPADADLVGRPVPGTYAELRDPDSGRSVPRGCPGELFLRGSHTFSGYLVPTDVVQPWPEPSVPGGWVATGDLACLEPDGFRLIGRRLGMVNVGGEKTPMEVIERAIDPAAPGSIAAVAVPGDTGDDQVVAVVEAGNDVTLESLWRCSAGVLSALVRPCGFIEVDRLPRLPSGKIDRGALRGLVE